MSDPRQIGIIGAGIAGLMAANFLALEGHQVTVFDRARVPGGSAGYYVFEGREYPTGATVPYGLEEGGPLRRLLECVGMSLALFPIEHCMDVVLKDRVVHVVQDERGWFEELQRAFPERKNQVTRFWRHLSRTARTVYQVASSYASLPIRRRVDLGRLPHLLQTQSISLFRLIPEAAWTVERGLRVYGLADYIPFRRFLNAQLIDAAQTDVTNAAWLPCAIALDIYRYGVYMMPGGLPALNRGLAEQASARGAQVRLSHTILKAEHEPESRKWHLTTNRNTTHGFDAVINASGVPIPGDGLPIRQEGASAWGAIRLDALVPSTWVKSLQLPVSSDTQPFALQIATNDELARFFGDPDGALYITIHPQPSRDEPHVISMSIHTPAALWMDVDHDTYSQQKERAEEWLVQTASQTLPGFAEHAQHVRIGTPRTYHRYLRKAVVGGTPLTLVEAVQRPSGARTRSPAWFLAGETVFPGPGTLSSALSGFYAARAIDPSVARRLFTR